MQPDPSPLNHQPCIPDADPQTANARTLLQVPASASVGFKHSSQNDIQDLRYNKRQICNVREPELTKVVGGSMLIKSKRVMRVAEECPHEASVQP